MNVQQAVQELFDLYGSQVKVAEKLGTTQQTVSRWMKGEIPPAAEMSRKVFALLDEERGSTGDPESTPEATDGGEAA